jgi:hypothetical protein
MSAYKFIGVSREGQIANLGLSFYTVELLAVDSVPESDTAISSASPTSKKTSLVRRPC